LPVTAPALYFVQFHAVYGKVPFDGEEVSTEEEATVDGKEISSEEDASVQDLLGSPLAPSLRVIA